MLDLASVGPAARASRMLADYGARVDQGRRATPKHGGVQIEPPFYAYGGHRGMERVLLDLKADAGTRGVPQAGGHAPTWCIESFRPGVVDRLGIGYDDVRAVNPGIVYCSTSGYGQTGPERQWAGHDINYLAVGGYLDCSGRSADGGPALPGATVADSAAGGMHAVISILAALVAPRRHGRGRSTSTCRSPTACVALMSLYIDEYLATGTVPGPGHNILTGRYACYDVYRCARRPLARGGRHRAPLLRQPLQAARLRAVARRTSSTTTCRTRSAPTSRAAFATRDRDEWVDELGPADTCVSPVRDRARAGRRRPLPRPRRHRHRAPRPTPSAFEQVGFVLAGMDHGQRLAASCATPPPPTPTRCSPRPGYDADDHRRPPSRRSRRMSDAAAIETDLPAEVAALIGQYQYEETGEFPVERGYIFTSCSSVENGNPLFWDDEVAAELTDGPIAPPTMLSVWFRPHHWAPGRTEQAAAAAGALRPQGAASSLPEAVMTRQHDHLPRAGAPRRRAHAPARSCARSAGPRPPSSAPAASG